MPVSLDTDRSSPELAEHATGAHLPKLPSRCLHIGLINNMPDGALQATERQFVKLLDSASDGIEVRLSLYALSDIPRNDWGRSRISHFYSSVETLWDFPLDGLIVTGAEPIAQHLADEPYWESLTEVFEWAEHNTFSTIWSCLAAHGAVLYLDGIPRHRLTDKRSGIFRCTQASDHPLTAGAPPVLQVPHSRWNDILESDLAEFGYRILTRARDGGVDGFVKQRKSLFVFLQGHPEYEASTLLLEYRRDIGRYLRGEKDIYPQMPQGYFDREAATTLSALREQAMANRHEELLADFPIAWLENRIKNRWRSTATHLYGNWLRYLDAQKQQRSRPASRGRGPTESKRTFARRRAQL
jgi:homoserine O-succinyltransferase